MKIAVVLFNLGGPDSLQAVKPFLFNLFYDRAILTYRNPLRWVLAKLISARREQKAMNIYKQLGGGSPLNINTAKQAHALEEALKNSGCGQFKVFTAMRYWHPLTEDVVKQVKDYQPDRIVLLPLYPQFSTTTTASSINYWLRCFGGEKTKSNTSVVCCYYNHEKFIQAHAEVLLNSLKELKSTEKPYILFSAHGLPQKVIDQGDPYQWQVEQTIASIVDLLRQKNINFDFEVCYQSRVGPLKWIGPSIQECMEKVAKTNQPVVVVPISFVSEHSETLVELDIEYKKIAYDLGVIEYKRVLSLAENSAFIECLKDIVMNNTKNNSCSSSCICPSNFKKCFRYG